MEAINPRADFAFEEMTERQIEQYVATNITGLLTEGLPTKRTALYVDRLSHIRSVLEDRRLMLYDDAPGTDSLEHQIALITTALETYALGLLKNDPTSDIIS